MQYASPSAPSRVDAPLPPRSRLFALEPHALQTSAVESFTSYLMRLARAHCVPLGTLIHVAVAPGLQNAFLAQGPSRNVTIFLRAAALLNSHGVSAADWVQALTALTLRTDLPLLTMLPWAQVLSSRQLVHPQRQWCPCCFEEWRVKRHLVYEPLVWTMAGVQVCSTHGCPLEQQCPACQQRSSWLAWHARPGFCHHCAAWLGHAASPSVSEVEASAIHQAALVGELLARTTKNEAVSQTQFLAALRKLVGQATQGNLAAFARLVGLTKTTLWELATGRFPPPLSVLLRLCLQLSLAKIAARLGVGKRVLRKYCPDQYQALRVSNKRWDSDEMKMYMRQTLQEALDGEEIVSLYAVQEYLGCQRRILYRIAPDLSEAVNARYQKHFPRALIDGHLREALTHTGPLLSLNALAKQNGWDPGFARSLFPELCRRISSQYKAWQMETRQQQREESYQKIREAIGTLHQKGLYPTKGQICRLIGDTFFMMRADRRSVWQVELEILGYK